MLVFLPFLTSADLQGSFPNLYFICGLIKNLFMLSVRISSYGWTRPTIYDFNSSVIFKHLKACLHNANNKRLGENARVKRSCLVFFMPLFSQTIQNKNQEIQVLSKPEFLNTSFLHFFLTAYCSLARIIPHLYFICWSTFLTRFFYGNE